MAETVTLGGQTVELRPVSELSYADRSDVALAYSTNVRRAWCAALGLAWGSRAYNPNRQIVYRGDPLAYGGQVMDMLIARGIADWEIRDAGAIAYAHVTSGLVFAREVEKELGNSDAAPAAASTDG